MFLISNLLLSLFLIVYRPHRIVTQTTQNINVLFVNEENNDIAEKAFDMATEYVKRTASLGLEIDPVVVTGNRTDARGFLKALCRKYDGMLSSKKYPHLVLDLTMTGVVSEAVKSFTAALALPTISSSFGRSGDLRQWRALSVNQTKFLLQVMPPADVLTDCVRAIVTKQDMKNAAIMFDESFVMDYKYKSLLQNIPTRHLFTQVKGSNKEDIKTQLRGLRELEIFNFFIMGSIKTIKLVLDAADENQYFGNKTSWFALSLEKGDISCDCKNTTIVYVKPTPERKSRDRLGKIKKTLNIRGDFDNHLSFYLDLSVKSLLAIKSLLDSGINEIDMKYISTHEYDGTNTPNRNLDLKTQFKEVADTNNPIYIPEDKEMYGRSYMEFNMELEAVTFKNGMVIGSKTVGSWKAGMFNPIQLKKPRSLTNYSVEVVYRIVTLEQKPMLYRDVDSPKGFKGYYIDLIEEISRILKFNYEIYLVPDSKFGTMDDNGNWNGLVNELLEKRADIGLASVAVTSDRMKVIDFTVPFDDLIGLVIMMKLHHSSDSLFNFVTVLENDVWLSIFAIYFFASLLFWMFSKWSPYSSQNNHDELTVEDHQHEFTLKECLYFCLSTFLIQGGSKAPKHISGLVLVATWWIFGFLIITVYTANIEAFLSVSRLDSPIESLVDLTNQYNIQYAPLNGSAAMMYFKRMADIEATFFVKWKTIILNSSLSDLERAKLSIFENPLPIRYTKLWQAMKDTRLPNTVEEAVQRVRESKSSSQGFAWIAHMKDVKYHVMTSCDLQMVGEEFSKKPHNLALQKGSPLTKKFNEALAQLLNTHKLAKMKDKWWKFNPEFQKTCNSQTFGITITNVGGIFIVFFLGIGLTCITLGAEYCWYKWRNNSNSVSNISSPMQMQLATNSRRSDRVHCRRRF